MINENIQMLEDTLNIFRTGKYYKDGKVISTKLSRNQMEECYVYLPDNVSDISNRKDFEHVHVMGRVGVGCKNIDSFSMAQYQYKTFNYLLSKNKENRVLVLNFANPVNPGGGVRNGARAQEEDLCRKSSLLFSLESHSAKRYYEYNKSLNTYLGSDAIILTPNVEIVKDADGNLLDESIIVSVMTCAAPMITYGKEGLTEAQYREMFYNRICGMLKCAAYWGYQALVLGAFGCGAFGNDAKLVSDLFYKALKEFNYDGMMAKDFFRRIDFAVLDKTAEKFNYNEFNRNFEHFYREEDNAEIERVLKRKKATEVNLDKIRGSLVGGAIGDALGYPVEFLSLKQILNTYGEKGITDYALDRKSGKALISDDTQMTLFTADGILVGETRSCMRGIGGTPHAYVPYSYQDWLTTQETDYSTGRNTKRYNETGGVSWLLDVPELYSRRAPGNTCLSALYEARNTSDHSDYIKNPRNNSKGCGGIMRVAPLGIHYANVNVEDLDQEAAVLSAITHGHPLGYMSSAVLVHILNRIVFSEDKKELKEIVIEARDTVCKLFKDTNHINELRQIIDKAIECAENNDTDYENIGKLGEGWVAEETLAIAIYCSLRYEHDFSGGVIAAVNHNGDSDSTGAVVGNILGAINGFDAIEQKWKNNLELYDVILEMADDLCHGCQMSEYSIYRDDEWTRKYMDMHWKEPVPEYLFFWHEYDRNGYLSNWFESEFVVDDFCYQNVEQYIMAQKAKLFHDSKNYTAILKTTSPKECKRLGRNVTPFDERTWEDNRYRILKEGVLAKFSQNEGLKNQLLASGNSIIAEASPYDDIFGIKLSAEEAVDVMPEQWPGRNLLGIALMEVREEIGGGMSASDIVNSSELDNINRFLRNGGSV